jgi:hypothetical protein
VTSTRPVNDVIMRQRDVARILAYSEFAEFDVEQDPKGRAP